MWDGKKKPVFNNITHSPVTGRDIHISLYGEPIYEFTLSNQWLSQADKDALMGFFLARRGSFESFLYSDEDCVMVNHVFAIGDGVTTTFQLGRFQNGLYHEAVHNFAPNPLIYRDGLVLTLDVDYVMTATGEVTYYLGNGTELSWTGQAYYRCVFMDDSLEYNQFANRLYDCNEIKFKGSLANKL
jgi:hypothetical protein